MEAAEATSPSASLILESSIVSRALGTSTYIWTQGEREGGRGEERKRKKDGQRMEQNRGG